MWHYGVSNPASCCITARAKFQLKEGSCVLRHYLHHLKAGAATECSTDTYRLATFTVDL